MKHISPPEDPCNWRAWPPQGVTLEFAKFELQAVVDAFEAVNSIGKLCHFQPMLSFVKVARGLSALESAIRRAERAVR